MTTHHLMGLLMGGFGAFLIAGAVKQWPWFTAGRRYRILQGMLGATGARAACALVGAVLVVFGVLQVAGRWRGGWDGQG